jgi:hypothetical protein
MIGMLRLVAATAIATVCGVCCPTVPDKVTAVTLKPAQVSSGGGVQITFVEVRNDSRCAAEVVCAWAGNAEVVVLLQFPGAKNLPPETVLNTTLEPRSVGFAATQVTLDSLKPHARQSPPIQQSDYIAYFSVRQLQY